MSVEFEEIAHSGGKVTFSIKFNESGGVSYRVKIQSSRPVPFTWIAVYALPQGIGMPATICSAFSMEVNGLTVSSGSGGTVTPSHCSAEKR